MSPELGLQLAQQAAAMLLLTAAGASELPQQVGISAVAHLR